MKSLRLTLHHEPAAVHPMHEFVADNEAFERYRLVHWNDTGEQIILLFHVIGAIDAYREQLESLQDREWLQSFELNRVDDRSFYAYVRDQPPEPWRTQLDAFYQDSLVIVPPVEYGMDRSLRFTLVGEGPDLRNALEAVPEGIETTVEWISEYDGRDAATAPLTDRQREALRVARELGYFSVPRKATVADVAAELECAPGTAAEHLRKAEAVVMDGLEL